MLNVFLVDDEAPARKRLRQLLEPFVDEGRVDIVGEASDGVEAVEKLPASGADLVFLDIRMPGLDGFDVLEKLPPEGRPTVAFTTAYDEYALRAFQANAVDYVLKPVSNERLEETLRRAERLSKVPSDREEQEQKLGKLLDWMDAQAEKTAKGGDESTYVKQLSIPYRDRILVTPVERIISIEISEGITRLYVLEESDPGNSRPKLRQHIVGYTLDQLSSMLHPDQFMRVHRSAIVQFTQIKELIPWFSGRYKLVLTGAHEVIASRERSKLLKERLNI
ncbi:MAG: response regulator transcription factor [Rhodothermales bacterium]|nr:response regulator transcription factor [Rhodothermales bacterium]MBO6779917.1 response regulator transcription factor [Rhodothermales bacterium]